MKLVVILAGALIASPAAAALVRQRSSQEESACEAENLKRRVEFQNKLAGACEDMCKEVGAYPKCDCPAFIPPDATPGKVTWPELLEYMDSLCEWAHKKMLGWKKVASALQKKAAALRSKSAQASESCSVADLRERAQLQNRLAGACEDMCKEVGSYPKCQCPAFVAPDATPGVVTWPELNKHMDNLVEWCAGLIKAWKARAASVLQKA